MTLREHIGWAVVAVLAGGIGTIGTVAGCQAGPAEDPHVHNPAFWPPWMQGDPACRVVRAPEGDFPRQGRFFRERCEDGICEAVHCPPPPGEVIVGTDLAGGRDGASPKVVIYSAKWETRFGDDDPPDADAGMPADADAPPAFAIDPVPLEGSFVAYNVEMVEDRPPAPAPYPDPDHCPYPERSIEARFNCAPPDPHWWYRGVTPPARMDESQWVFGSSAHPFLTLKTIESALASCGEDHDTPRTGLWRARVCDEKGACREKRWRAATVEILEMPGCRAGDPETPRRKVQP